MSLNILYGATYIFAAWKWGDWKHWRKYYPTILFFILGDLLYQFLLHDHSMWKFEPVGVDKELPINHTTIVLSVIFIKYPATILIFLGRFPEGRFKQIIHIATWIAIYVINEYLTLKLNGMTYHNGWNFASSLFFTIVMFLILRIHHTRPLLAWIFSGIFILFLWKVFHVPFDILK
ncbi:CBO0543 family protein [Pseudalkalibacillus caeni]|uniref:CBO0543 family protein n=1 Tax=Exobacillus caeni TaxID=2574798 RepID=UPI0026872DB5